MYYLQRTINTPQFIGDGKNSLFKVIGQSCELLPQGLFNPIPGIRLNLVHGTDNKFRTYCRI